MSIDETHAFSTLEISEGSDEENEINGHPNGTKRRNGTHVN
jgi:hypothetical protein